MKTRPKPWWLRNNPDWQPDPDLGAVAGERLQGRPAAVRVGDRLHDRQAEAAAASPFRATRAAGSTVLAPAGRGAVARGAVNTGPVNAGAVNAGALQSTGPVGRVP